MIATLQQLDTMRADFTVPEQQLGDMTMDQVATFGLTEEAFPYHGRITGIDPKIDPQTRMVSVRAEVENPDGALRPGQFVRVRVELPAVESVIALPQTAVVTSLYGDYVYRGLPVDEKEQQPAECRVRRGGAERPRTTRLRRRANAAPAAPARPSNSSWPARSLCRSAAARAISSRSRRA